ncbi:DivIVA domain-containing protein [Streptomyces griseus]|uniref:DivIVA domain-containing protein n=1 Tax=Streptomyces griseus TaxID=1911 RepID=UPI0033C349FC
MLTPADIESQRFTGTRLREGYDQEEVDGFLDRIAEGMRREEASRDAELVSLRAEIRRQRAELDAARRPVPQDADQPSLDSIKVILVAAQKTADQVVADAHAQAGSVLADASTQAERLIANARTEGHRIVNEAHGERQQQVERLERRQEELASLVADLDSQRSAHRDWLKRVAALAEGDSNGE